MTFSVAVQATASKDSFSSVGTGVEKSRDTQRSGDAVRCACELGIALLNSRQRTAPHFGTNMFASISEQTKIRISAAILQYDSATSMNFNCLATTYLTV